MGTVEKIVDNLAKMGQDKRAQASQRYNELSTWLSHEVRLIKSLIESNTRESSFATASEGHDAVESVDAESSSSIKANSRSGVVVGSANKDKDKLQRQKRKSPETRQTGTSSSESPDQKRNSLDYEELAVAAGLPADLNKLRKDDLLVELEKRNVSDHSMKSLKKELIDALRIALVEESKTQSDPTENWTETSEGKCLFCFISFTQTDIHLLPGMEADVVETIEPITDSVIEEMTHTANAQLPPPPDITHNANVATSVAVVNPINTTTCSNTSAPTASISTSVRYAEV